MTMQHEEKKDLAFFLSFFLAQGCFSPPDLDRTPKYWLEITLFEGPFFDRADSPALPS